MSKYEEILREFSESGQMISPPITMQISRINNDIQVIGPNYHFTQRINDPQSEEEIASAYKVILWQLILGGIIHRQQPMTP